MVEPTIIRTRSAVRELRGEGKTVSEIAAALEVTKSTVCYHLRRLGEPVKERCNRRYDWEEVRRYYEAGHSVNDCLAHFGMTRAAFVAAVRRGALVTRPQRLPIEELLGVTRNRTHLKKRLYDAGLKEPRCERCGLEEWLGEPLSMALHHVNGDGSDNRLENLQILCPNCHSQTDNFSGRNRRRPLAVPAALS
jgi:DNA-binding transcriptional ArsR family regulator